MSPVSDKFKVSIVRVAQNASCTQGVLIWDDVAQYLTLEPPWRNNQVGKSCIPHGTYPAERHQSPKHGECILLSNVPNRSEILIHKGNTSAETAGCVLIGKNFGRYDGQPAVLNSSFALADFLRRLDYLGHARFTIEILGV